jgi:hypothetical protein
MGSLAYSLKLGRPSVSYVLLSVFKQRTQTIIGVLHLAPSPFIFCLHRLPTLLPLHWSASSILTALLIVYRSYALWDIKFRHIWSFCLLVERTWEYLCYNNVPC